ncbi:MAG: PaaI family thioesterase [Anaerolineae bacterium]
MSDDNSPRSRTLTWQDPLIGAAAFKSMSGIDYLRGWLEGKHSPAPMSLWCNMRLLEVEAGRVIFTAQAGEEHYNTLGTVHGGFSATVLDTALGCSVMSVTPIELAYTTVQLNVSLVRAITTTTGVLRAIGEVIHAGRKLATAEAKLIDADGKLYAHGTTTCLVFPREGTA